MSKISMNEKLDELEQIVKALGDDGLGFEQSLDLYEKGAIIVKLISDNFEKSKGRITKITQIMGAYTEEDL